MTWVLVLWTFTSKVTSDSIFKINSLADINHIAFAIEHAIDTQGDLVTVLNIHQYQTLERFLFPWRTNQLALNVYFRSCGNA